MPARSLTTLLPTAGRAALVALAVIGAACDVDRFFEGPAPIDVKLSVTVESNVVAVAPGNTATVGASITRIGEYRGDVIFKLSGVPDGVDAEIGAQATSGQVTTTTITFRVGGTVAAGSYVVTVHGSGGTSGGAAATEVELRVSPVPAIALVPAKPSLTIIRGGVALVGIAITRTAYQGAITLSLMGASGITATVAGGAAGSGSADVTIAVAADVAPGTYTMTLRGSGSGIADRDVPLTVVVSPDALQVLVGDAVTPQASLVTAGVIVNRFGVSGPVVLSVEGLPTGVTVSFTDGSSAATATFAVSAGVAPGAYILTIRGRSAGVSDATSPFVLTVGASNVAVTLVPQSVTVLQGASAASTLTLIRTSYDGSVAVQVLGVPEGISVVATEAVVTGSTTFLTVTTDRALVPGVYTVTVRAIPSPLGGPGTPALDPVTSTLTITVLPAPAGAGNVVLDWSGCAEPQWVAAQDGSGPWTRLTGAQGVFRFTVNAGRGGYAYSEGGTELTVRFGTATELAAASINLCPEPSPVTRTVTGTAQHSGSLELFTWRMGGGVGLSTVAAPNFNILGVHEGIHDLIGWGVSQVQGQRMHITRDVTVGPAGATVGTVSLVDERSFTPQSAPLNISGFNNEARAYTMSYLSDAACTANELYTSSSSGAATSGTSFNTMLGVPTVWQRPDDYHRLDVVASNAAGLRTVSVSFHGIIARGVALPPAVFPGVLAISGTYKRMRVSVGAGIPTTYNGSLTLRYSGGGRAMAVSASVAALGTGTPILDMPELGSVAGFPFGAVIPADASGTWSLVLDGSTGTPLCSDESGRWSLTRNGVF